MNKPVRSTIFFAILCGVLYLPLLGALSRLWFYPSAFQILVWGQLAVYAVLLARWSHTRLWRIAFPLLLLLMVTLLPGAYGSFVILALGMLSWIRSGICYHNSSLRSLLAELATVAGGVALFAFLTGPSALSTALGMTLFGVVQSLYFFIIPMNSEEKIDAKAQDPFEQAFLEAEKIIDAH